MNYIGLVVATVAFAFAAPASAIEYCGPLENNYGPFDYRTDKMKLPIVDRAHFTDEVEAGIRGSTAKGVGGDLAYTLRSFPNHHRALATLARVALRDKAVMIPDMKWPVECFFLRAQRFAPNDAVVHGTYGAYLFNLGQIDNALMQYRNAIELDPDNALLNYNIGLAYMKKNDVARALAHAHKAYGQGYPLPGLKNQLMKAGKWTEPVAAKKPESSAEEASQKSAASVEADAATKAIE